MTLLLGATGGIGSALADRLRERGHRLVGVARDAQRLRAFAERLDSPVLAGDAADPAFLQRAVDLAIEEYGRLDSAACLVGSILLKPAHMTSPEEFEFTLRQNLYPAFNLLRSAAPVLAKSGGGSVALVSSAAAGVGLPSHEAIAAAKAAIEGLTRSAAATYAPRGVRVNCVAPGLVRTPLSEPLTSSPTALAASVAQHALGRIGEPDDVAAALSWLLDPNTSWVTGQVIGVDGGLGAVRARSVARRP